VIHSEPQRKRRFETHVLYLRIHRSLSVFAETKGCTTDSLRFHLTRSLYGATRTCTSNYPFRNFSRYFSRYRNYVRHRVEELRTNEELRELTVAFRVSRENSWGVFPAGSELKRYWSCWRTDRTEGRV